MRATLIQSINISNFLLIEQASIHLTPKFTVFTGESGSGKSLVFKALRFAFGGRLDKSYIGSWNKELVVRLTGHVSSQLQALFEAYDIPAQDGFILEHRMSQDSRSCHINTKKVSMKELKEIAKVLVLHSEQNRHVKIQDLGFQNGYLDVLLDQDILENFEKTQSQLDTLIQKKIEMQAVLSSEDEDWLIHQTEELSQVLVDDRTVEDLQTLVDESQKTEQVRKEWMAKKDQIQAIHKGLLSLRQVESISLEEMVLEIQNSLDAIEQAFQSEMGIDLQTQYEAEEAKGRLSKINDLARKHKSHPKDLYALLERYRDTLEKIDIAKRDMGSIDGSIDEVSKSLEMVSKALKSEQLKHGGLLSAHITQQLVLMGMEQASFKIEFMDRAYRMYPTFMIKSNPGQPYKPIGECLSGGEMSRLSILLTIYQNPHLALILDEVDTGVSGVVGIKIRDLLRQLSERQQILCISHLAQVASGADSHYVVEKGVENKVARTYIHQLSRLDRAKELSRLMCGHVDDEMIEQANRLLKLSE